MPCIRRKYHYRIVYLGPEIQGDCMPLCGQTVPMLHNSTTENVHFAGFVDVSQLQADGGAVITGLTGYTPDDCILGNWQALDPYDMFLGLKAMEGVTLALCNGKPINLGRLGKLHDAPQRSTSNVVRL